MCILRSANRDAQTSRCIGETMMKQAKSGCSWRLTVALALAAIVANTMGCQKSEKGSAPAAQGASQTQQPAVSPLSADALEELLAPVALYPDPVLIPLLRAAGNPQEILDAGNWLLQNTNLTGDALDKAATAAGFSPSTQVLIHFPDVVDNLCQQMDWTKQLGSAFQSDQKGVLDSVQRLRAKAVQVGNLKSSPQMTVETRTEQGQQIVAVAPADPKVVYVPQYDPEKVYTQQPVQAAPATAVVQNSSGVSTNTAVLTGLLAFGGGVVVGALINNHHDDYYRGYGGGYYYPPPPPYRPIYPGYRPSYGYQRPVHYGNTNVVVVNNKNYYNRFQGNTNLKPGYRPVPYSGQGGGYQGGNYNRPGNNQLPSARPGNSNWKGQTTYQAANRPAPNNGRPGGSVPPARFPTAKLSGSSEATNRPNNGYAGKPNPGAMNRSALGSTTQAIRPGKGSQTAGQISRPASQQARLSPNMNSGMNANNRAATRASKDTPAAVTQNRPSTMPTARPAPQPRSAGGDRGYGQPTRQAATPSRPSPSPSLQNKGGAFGGGNSGKSERVASSRGQSSMNSGGGKKKRS